MSAFHFFWQGDVYFLISCSRRLACTLHRLIYWETVCNPSIELDLQTRKIKLVLPSLLNIVNAIVSLRSAMESSFAGIRGNRLAALKPLLTLTRWLGIELDPTRQYSKKWKCLSLLVTFTLFIVNVSCNTFFCGVTFNAMLTLNYSSDITELSSSSVAESWNLILDSLIYTILVIGSHAVLLSFRWLPQWKRMWPNLQQLADCMGNDIKFQKKCRCVVYGLIVTFFIVRSLIT